MAWLVGAVILILASGVPGVLAGRQRERGEKWSFGLILTGAGMGTIGVAGALSGRHSSSFRAPWQIPGGEFSLAVDPLTAIFLLPLLLILAAGSLYALGYWPQRENTRHGRKLRLFYGLIGGAMILLLTARNGLLFLLAWEIMALSGFFLVTTEEEKPEVRKAGLIYLAATHTGTLALFALFVLLGQAVDTFGFPAAESLAGDGSMIFLLGLFGFGLKAGLMPLHIWLPGAHAAAPSHASALLSGAMIKTGIYGLMRLTSFFSAIPPWWGWTVLALGAISGVLGVALAVAQHDMKRLLAYHSVENIGIIALGFGIALLGRSYGIAELALLGMAGALLHVVNHGLFKSLLFLSAGSVIHSVGQRDLDRLGGLLKRQPWTGVFFLGGAVAICGLPPFNGFISEWLIYQGSFRTFQGERAALHMAVLAAPVLALIGALAVACFVKVFGLVFLGEARTPEARQAREAGWTMRLPMAVLLAACAWIGLFPGTAVPLLERAAGSWAPLAGQATMADQMAPLYWIGGLGWVLLLALAGCGGWLARRGRRSPRDVATWGCGYTRPATRMQYSASSFADGLVGMFRFGLWTERHGGRVEGVHPAPAKFSSHTPDAVLDRLLLPAVAGTAWLFNRLRAVIQNGQLAFYLLYVVLTLIVLLSMTFFG